ncbi:hypothetical protein AVEN_57751-1, partial [Araneus ventricosus]
GLQVKSRSAIQCAVHHSAAHLSDEGQHSTKEHFLQYGRHMLANDIFQCWCCGSVSRCTFDSKNPHHRKSQVVRSEDLGGNASEKDQRIT